MRFAFWVTKYNRYSFVPLYYLLDKSGFDFKVYFSVDELEEADFDVLFFSFTTLFAEETYKVLSKLRSQRNFVAVAGGPHPTAMWQEVLHMGFDAVVIGEVEPIWEVLCKDLVKKNLRRVYSSKLSACFPKYSLRASPYLSALEIVRGCPFGCRFCQVSYMFGRRVRYRPLKDVLDEAGEIVKRGRRFVRFIAPNALSYLSRDGVTPELGGLRKLFEGLLDVGVEQIYFGSFPSEIRPDSVNEKIVKLMAEYCYNKRVVVGAQSGSNYRLKKLNRGHTVEDVERAVTFLNDYGFVVSLDFIFGFPEETESELKETLVFMERLLSRFNVRIHAHTFIPLPGTPYWGKKPSEVPKWFKRVLHGWERDGLLDGNWAQQEHARRKLCVHLK